VRRTCFVRRTMCFVSTIQSRSVRSARSIIVGGGDVLLVRSTMSVPVFLGSHRLPVRIPSSLADSATGALPGPDSHETVRATRPSPRGLGRRAHTPARARCEIRFQYVSDSLWNIKSDQQDRFASWNRFRWTVDIDFGALTGQQGLYFHATALWQGGGNLGTYLGLLTSPSGMSSANTCSPRFVVDREGDC